MPNKDASNRSSAETITPLRIPIKNQRIVQDRLGRRHRFSVIMLIGAVIFLVVVGTWFLHYLAQNPIQPPPVINKPTAQTPESAVETATRPEVKAANQPETKPVSLPQTKATDRAETKSVTRPQPKATNQAEAKPKDLPQAKAGSQPLAPPPPAVTPEQLALDKQAAEQKLADFLTTKNELDGKGAAEWGKNFYNEVTEIGRMADSLFIKKEYNSASAEYARATVIGRQLADRADEALLRMLEEGRIALTEGNGVAAQHKFQVALMIEPANQAAQKGLKRSQTIETVHHLIKSGEQHEKDHALSLARTEYKKALQIDPEANEARQALNRVMDLIKEQQFSQLMSAGLTALNNNDLALARTQLLKAKSLKTNSREVSDALLQVDQALRLARIDRLRDAAQKAEQAEDWQAALKSYLAVLDIDQNLQFATHGKERARQQIRIAKRLDFFLTQPQILESNKQLKNAVLLLQDAKETVPRGQKLISRIGELEKLVVIAQTPVIVTIESDNLTQIAVYKVGRFGQFSQRELKLRPGTYTVVGARDGYQDVRQKIVVKPGQQAMRVTVKCKVKI